MLLSAEAWRNGSDLFNKTLIDITALQLFSERSAERSLPWTMQASANPREPFCACLAVVRRTAAVAVVSVLATLLAIAAVWGVAVLIRRRARRRAKYDMFPGMFGNGDLSWYPPDYRRAVIGAPAAPTLTSCHAYFPLMQVSHCSCPSSIESLLIPCNGNVCMQAEHSCKG